MQKKYKFFVNGERVEVDADAEMPLLWVLRDKLGITGPKYGCGSGICRACTSHLDGDEIQTCQVPVSECANKRVTTIEGLADGDQLHPVQQAWIDADVGQCGFCQPGQIMAAVALLKRTSEPSDADIDAIENMCRCGTYLRIREAIKAAAAMPPGSDPGRPDKPEKPEKPEKPRGGQGKPEKPDAGTPDESVEEPGESDDSLIGGIGSSVG